jgi:probable F420-dependent oxidoreductase
MIGPIGIWTFGFRSKDVPVEWATELEELGYGSIWIPGGAGGSVLGACERVLGVTRSLTVATGILNIWKHEPAEVAEQSMALGERFLLGVGISHSALIGDEYRSPLDTMRRYLDDLDAAGHDPARRIVAALRPKMLRLAAERSVGTHPYFVPAAHAAAAREGVGPDKLVYPEVTVVLEPEAGTARTIARQFMSTYLQLPNYVNNLRHLGWSEADVTGGGSDALVDAIVAWGDAEAVATKVRAHLDAGADGACLQVLTPQDAPEPLPMATFRALAPALFP